ncbi:MAG: hypothetical protein LBQ74_13000 [Prevotella sp.]|jgi:hypothetical protein|nr:hypothetical protein [Prevotella sp.]
MAIKITPDFVRASLSYRHPNYNMTVELAKELKIHADGLFPERLISVRRPSESEGTFEYRKNIYEPKTKECIGKVFTELQKIRRSQDWSIEYDPDDIPKRIADNETLERYCEFNYPGFESVTNFVFSELLKRYLIDANSFVAMTMKALPAKPNEYIKPAIEIFSSDQVLDYVEDEYVVLKSADKNTYKSNNNRMYQGDIIYVITPDQLFRFKQVTGKYDMEMNLQYDHNFGYIPAFKVGGEYKCRVNNDTVYQSRIHYMLPELNEAAREHSDLQAEIVQHIFSEKYYITNSECQECRGTGRKPDNTACTKCNGIGKLANTSPYGAYIIETAKAAEQSVPIPPFGYITKDTKIAELQDKRVETHIYNALASINMEFLSKTPLVQSGIAKEVDRDALNTFVASIAEDIVKILDKIYKFICDARYSAIVPNEEERNKMLPSIAVPEKFDILNSSYFMDEIIKADGKVSPYVKKNLELEYIRKRYNANPDVADKLQCILDLDPLYGYTQDDKMAMLSDGGITEQDYVMSCNISQLVDRGIDEHDDFLKKTFREKKEIIGAYVDEIIEANDIVSALKDKMNTDNSDNSNDNSQEKPEDGREQKEDIANNN